MKITGYRTESFHFSRGRTLGDANSPAGSDRASGTLLFLETDGGVEGVTLGGSSSLAKLFPALEGQDPRGVRGIYKAMHDLASQASLSLNLP